MVRTVLAILSIALLSACGLKGPLYPSDQGRAEPPAQTQPAFLPTLCCRTGKSSSDIRKNTSGFIHARRLQRAAGL